METIKCIRFEGTDGFGLFHTNNIDICFDLSNLYYRHFCNSVELSDKRKYFPNPETDGLNLDLLGKEWFCAFKNIQQVKRIFYYNEIQKCLSFGIKIYMLEVSEFQAGRRQIVYTKESIIKKVDISELFL